MPTIQLFMLTRFRRKIYGPTWETGLTCSSTHCARSTRSIIVTYGQTTLRNGQISAFASECKAATRRLSAALGATVGESRLSFSATTTATLVAVTARHPGSKKPHATRTSRSASQQTSSPPLRTTCSAKAAPTAATQARASTPRSRWHSPARASNCSALEATRPLMATMMGTWAMALKLSTRCCMSWRDTS